MLVTVNKLEIQSEYQGQPLMNKNNEPYKMAWLEFTGPDGDGKASMYIGGKYEKDVLEKLREFHLGTQVDVVIEQVGKYTNFKFPSKASKEFEGIRNEINSIKMRLERLEGAQGLRNTPVNNDIKMNDPLPQENNQSPVSQNLPTQTASPGDPNYINPDDIPW